MASRRNAICLVTAVAIAFGTLFLCYGYKATWRLCNVSSMSPHFADLRTITHGAELVRLGHDPLFGNPADPWHRPLNYPRIWQRLAWLGLDRTHTTAVGIGVILTFLVGIVLVLPDANRKTLALVGAAMVSPAVLLGVERCNVDLLMFFLVAVAVVLVGRSVVFASGAMMLAFVLKLHPIFAFAMMLRLDRKRFGVLAAVIVSLVMIYTITHYIELSLISIATPRSSNVSFGRNVFWMKMQNIDENLGMLFRWASQVGVAVLLVGSMWFATRSKLKATINASSLNLDAFRAGSAIFIGTFLIGNNWDYRLMFLIFVLPQLGVWMGRCETHVRFVARAALMCIFISLWRPALAGIIWFVPNHKWISYVVDETVNWLLFALLLYLFFLTLPDWLRLWMQRVMIRDQPKSVVASL